MIVILIIYGVVGVLVADFVTISNGAWHLDLPFKFKDFTVEISPSMLFVLVLFTWPVWILFSRRN